MSIKNKTGVGADYVPAYQISGVPYVTSSQSLEVGATPIAVRFPRVTRFVNVTNFSGGAMRMGFTANGINGLGQFSGSAGGGGTLTIDNHSHDNYFVILPSSSTGRLEIRCKEVFFRKHDNDNCDFSIIAGLTGIDKNQFPVLTGSNFFQGVG